jgi:hypothetical protein
VPTSMATRTPSGGCFMRSAADQLGAGLVPVQGDQRAVQGAGGIVAARVVLGLDVFRTCSELRTE